MDPITLAALLGTAVNVVATWYNNEETKKRDTAAQQAADKAWQRQNEYNSPTAQAERLKAAGLNPAAFINNYQASTPQTIDPSALIPYKVDMSAIISAMGMESTQDLNSLKAEFLENEDIRKELSFLTDEEEARERIKILKTQGKIKNKEYSELLKGFFTGKNIGDKATNFLTKFLLALMKD